MSNYFIYLADLWPRLLKDVYLSEIKFDLKYGILFLKLLLLEAPLYFFFLRKIFRPSRIAWALLICNLLTHPLICFWAIPVALQTEFTYGFFVLVVELYALSAEILILRFLFKASWNNAILAGFWANLFSWFIGGLLQRLNWL